jgi:NAD(P)H-quinone oxidoreductase subunit 4
MLPHLIPNLMPSLMLTPLLLISAIGAAIIGLWPLPITPARGRQIALVTTALSFGWSLMLLWQFNLQLPGLQFQENWPWLADLGLSYDLGLDGLSLPLVVLNGLLMGVAVYSSDLKVERPRLYFSLVLLLNVGVLGAFLAQNLLLFFLFYELELIPLYLLISIWGGARRGYAGMKFLLYTAVSGILIFVGFLGIAWLTGSFSVTTALQETPQLSLATQLILLGTLLLGFGIKIPIVPLHTWLPDAHVEASTPVSVILAGVLLKLGTYGLLRFCVGMFPEAWAVLAPYLATWAVVTVLYGALTAIAQTDMKKMVAYSSVAHMGYILLAAAAGTPLSNLAAVMQMVSHGLISGLLFLLVGVVQKKTGTRDIQVLRGLLTPERGLPMIGSLMIMGVMASAGIPGMIGFISEFMVFRGSFAVFPIQTLLCMIGTGLTAVYFLLLVNRSFFGRLPAEFANLPPVLWRERLPGALLASLIVVLGLQPSWLARWSQATMSKFSLPVAVISHPAEVNASQIGVVNPPISPPKL